jgi:hypothetical protein
MSITESDIDLSDLLDANFVEAFYALHVRAKQTMDDEREELERMMREAVARAANKALERKTASN